ncbi:MAG TPA: PAS domain-containing protein [Rhizomicrobium sp.]|jgi:hypothetical protein
MALPARKFLEVDGTDIAVDWDLAFSQTATRQALAYWRTLCGDRTMPMRQELVPRDMRAFLPFVNLVDVVADPAAFDYCVRLEGQHARDLHGHVASGRISETLPEESRRRWHYCFETVRRAARPARFSSRIHGKQWLDAELLVAPLGDETGTITSLFCVLVSWRSNLPAELPRSGTSPGNQNREDIP